MSPDDDPALIRQAILRLDIEIQQLRAELAALKAGPKADELLTAAEAAKVLKTTEKGVRMSAWRGTIPYQKVGGRLRFRRGDLTKK